MSATFFIQRSQTFFYFLHVFLRFLTFFLNFHLNVYYIYDGNPAFAAITAVYASLSCRAHEHESRTKCQPRNERPDKMPLARELHFCKLELSAYQTMSQHNNETAMNVCLTDMAALCIWLYWIMICPATDIFRHIMYSHNVWYVSPTYYICI